jgi:hypothetical protein
MWLIDTISRNGDAGAMSLPSNRPEPPPTPAAMFVWTVVLLMLGLAVVCGVLAWWMSRQVPPSEYAPRVQRLATIFFAVATALTILRGFAKALAQKE